MNPSKQTRKPSNDIRKDREPLRVRTGIKAGDVYMHNPR